MITIIKNLCNFYDPNVILKKNARLRFLLKNAYFFKFLIANDNT